MPTTNNDARLAGALVECLKAFRSVAGFLGRVGSEEANDCRSRVVDHIEQAERLLAQGGKP